MEGNAPSTVAGRADPTGATRFFVPEATVWCEVVLGEFGRQVHPAGFWVLICTDSYAYVVTYIYTHMYLYIYVYYDQVVNIAIFLSVSLVLLVVFVLLLS